MAMAKKKPAQRSAVKKTGKKTVKASAAQRKAAGAMAGKKKPPAMKAAVRVTRENIKSVKPASKLASSQLTAPADPPPTVIDAVPVTAPVTARVTRPISHDEIRHRAYLKWEAAGRPPGDGGHFWAEAERELLQQS
jgi:hypothetical protein